jgi:hypothetical protein
MTPHSDKRGGSLLIDRVFPHVGRVKRASGTTHRPTFRAIDDALTALYERGRLDLLRAMRDKQLTPLQVYEAFRANRLEALPTAETLVDLRTSWEQWAAGAEVGDEHRRHYGYALTRLLAMAKGGAAPVAELPTLLGALREQRKSSGEARAFNLTKSAAQAFVRATLKKSHPLYLALGDIDALAVTKKRIAHPFTVLEVDRLCAALVEDAHGGIYEGRGEEAASIARVMAHTSMHAEEYWGEWTVMPDRIHIAGTKRAGRVRDVPRLLGVAEYSKPEHLSPKTFALRVARAADRLFAGGTVYDLRRAFANWCEAAGVPRTRRKLYLGHAAGDVTDLYERHEVQAFLAEDARKLNDYIASERASVGPQLVREVEHG